MTRFLTPWLGLILGASIGALIALLLHLSADDTQASSAESEDVWPRDALARVGTTYLREADLQRLRSTTVGEMSREQLIAELIDEEVLVQHALDTDLLRRQPRAAQVAIDALITSLNADIDATPADEQTLRALYAADPRRFAPTHAQPPPFERVRQRVERSHREDERQRTLNAYLRWLRQRANLENREVQP